MTDILFLAGNRLAFTKASHASLLRNTDWELVDRLWLHDDCSEDGTREFLESARRPPVEVRLLCPGPGHRLGGPAAVTVDFLRRSGAELFAKLDNDVIVPPGWLNRCVDVMLAHPELDLLGIEPPWSRTPHHPGGKRSPAPELEGEHEGYAPCDSIGGVGLMRARAFRDNPGLTGHSTYGGFTEWQVNHPVVRKGWIAPPLGVFLLDRLPVEPWRSLSAGYTAKGWQREWSDYPASPAFWDWWDARG